MEERTIKIGSAGKIFSLTGWKVGWMVAAPALAQVVARAHQFLTFSTAPNLQAAVAFGLNEGDAWLRPMRERFAALARPHGRGSEVRGLCDARCCRDLFHVRRSRRFRNLPSTMMAFASAAVEKAGVAVVPLSAFAEQVPTRHLVRVCFSKKDETIEAGVAAMAKARELFS